MSPELRRALEERLESADEDFREARANLRSLATLLLVLGLFTILAGLGLYLVEITSNVAGPADRREASIFLATQWAQGSVFLGCALWVRRIPRLAAALALAVWLGAEVALALQAPLSALPLGLGGFLYGLVRLVILVLLVRGLIQAVRGHLVIARNGGR